MVGCKHISTWQLLCGPEQALTAGCKTASCACPHSSALQARESTQRLWHIRQHGCQAAHLVIHLVTGSVCWQLHLIHQRIAMLRVYAHHQPHDFQHVVIGESLSAPGHSLPGCTAGCSADRWRCSLAAPPHIPGCSHAWGLSRRADTCLQFHLAGCAVHDQSASRRAVLQACVC